MSSPKSLERLARAHFSSPTEVVTGNLYQLALALNFALAYSLSYGRPFPSPHRSFNPRQTASTEFFYRSEGAKHARKTYSPQRR